MARMSGMRILPAIASVGFVLAVPILLFTTNIRFLASGGVCGATTPRRTRASR